MSQKLTVQPPRLAAWLVDLFTPPNQSDAITGDLLEEFTTVVSTSGSGSANRWYWRQATKTVAHLIRGEFRSSPWAIAATAFAGYLLLICAVQLVNVATGALLKEFQIYHYVSARLFWWIYAVALERVICPMLIGWMLAAIARNREMATAATLSMIVALLGVPLYLGGGLLWLLSATAIIDKAHRYVPHANFLWLVRNAFILMGMPPFAVFVGAVIRRISMPPERKPIAV